MQILENVQLAAALALAILAAILSGNPTERVTISHYFSQVFAEQTVDASLVVDPGRYVVDGRQAESLTGID